MERSDESKESDMEKSYEEAKLSESTDHITLDSTTYEQTEEIIEQSFQSEDFEIKEAKQEDMDESFEEKDDEMDKSGTISEATSEYKPTMAFENLGFSDEDNIRENQVITKGQESPEKSYLSKQISSEDLEERPTQFDFDAELREEIEQQQIAIQEMEKRQAEFQFSHYLITSKHDIIDQTVLENKEDDKHQEDLKRSDDFVSNLQEEEVQEGELDMVESDTQEEDEDILEGRSSESSSDNGEVFDEISGRFVPWEIQHQFRRQFSDSYINQEKKTSLQSARSIDLGTFYRRDHDDQTQYDSVTFMKETDASDSAETSPNKPVQRKQVRFSFNDSDVEPRAESPQELEEETLRFEQYYIKESPDKIVRFVDSGTETDLSVDDYRQQYVDASKTEKLSPSEPHNLISETHEQAVIDNILKSRMAVRVEHRDAATTTSEEELTIQRSSVSSFSSEATTSSFVTTGSFAELSIERTSAEKHIVTDHLSGEELFAREDVTTDTSLTPVKETSSTLDSEVISVVSRESRLAQQELLQESSDERDRSLSPSNESEELSTTYEGQETEVHEQKSESKFTIAFPSFGKSLADNEIYESSETGDTTEEKLSPIEETPQDDFPEEQEEIKPEKKVTFQTEHDVQHLQSASSEDLVKTSTSSSEMSMEPTLLAASYDLDSGHVSHVVTAYDMSPDSVEKQFPVPATTKAILSSPEDDVFEADACTFEDDKGFLMVSDTGKKIMSREKKLSSSGESCPSPPAPTPKDSSAVAHETMPDLEGAAIKLQDELIDSNEDLTPECENSQDLEITLRDSKLETKQETTEGDKTEHSPCDDTDSPFEILSPVDAEEFEKYMEDSGKSQQMATSFESVTTTTSSFSEIQSSDIMTMSDQKSEMMMSFEVAPLEPSAPPMPDIKSESSFEQSSPISSEPSEKGLGSPLDVPEHSDSGILLPDLVQGSAVCGDQQTQSLKGQKVSLPNGPTEVEYNPEIDIDYSEDYTPAHMTESEQPDIIQSTSPTMPTGQTTVFDIEATETQQEKQIDSEEKQEIRTTEEVQREAALYESTSYVTHEVIEELRVQPGFDPLASSDQTLYGLDMPSEETGGMSISMSQMESSGRFDTEPESDSINVSGGLVSQLDEDTSEKDLVMTETDKEVDSGLPQSQLEASSDALDEKDDEMAYTTTENLEIEQEIAAPPEETISYDIKSYTVYPGKRALELDETQEEILQREAEMEILTGVEALTPDSDTQDIRDLQDIQATQEDRENLEYQEQEIDGCQMYVEQIYEEADDTYDDNDDEGYMRGGEEMVGVDEFKQQTLTVEEDEFAGKSDDELLELVEDKEDNSQVKVLVTKPSRGDESVQEGQSEYEEGDDNQEKFDLEVDVYDLERPVTPTPVDAKQQFFSEDEIYQDTEKDMCEDEGVQTEDGEMIGEIPEQKTIYVSGKLVNTASEFVENVLSEARQRVTMETTEEKECITEVETSKTDVVLEYVKERMEEQEEEEQEIEEEEGKETSEQLV
ncbi:hypothetical protein KUTeg_003539 [Tegillarca granosa]|uniref:Uncharacterized protein n=1 Tax=Tegillarca granosa TaxID=220873 RepID=A0ABQ9FRY1_TEGGR|nr:hypothetical protein KUTeg_003539 [Tegillarca granosa]